MTCRRSCLLVKQIPLFLYWRNAKVLYRARLPPLALASHMLGLARLVRIALLGVNAILTYPCVLHHLNSIPPSHVLASKWDLVFFLLMSCDSFAFLKFLIFTTLLSPLTPLVFIFICHLDRLKHLAA